MVGLQGQQNHRQYLDQHPPFLFRANTRISRPQEIDARNVSAEAREIKALNLEVTLDNIDTWENVVKYCGKFAPELLLDNTTERNAIKLFKFSATLPPELEFCLIIRDDWSVETYRGHEKVAVCDLIDLFGVNPRV